METYEKVSIQKAGNFYKVTGAHLPPTQIYSKRNALRLAEARIRLLDRKTAIFSGL